MVGRKILSPEGSIQSEILTQGQVPSLGGGGSTVLRRTPPPPQSKFELVMFVVTSMALCPCVRAYVPLTYALMAPPGSRVQGTTWGGMCWQVYVVICVIFFAVNACNKKIVTSCNFFCDKS